MASYKQQPSTICLFTIILYITAPFSRVAAWDIDCPRECQCHLTSLGHLTMSQWVISGSTKGNQQKEPLKVVMCVLGSEALMTKLFRKIPSDTQVLTILQTQDSPPLVLMENHVQHLRQLLALEVRAHVPIWSTSHLALGSEALKPLRKIQYLSLNGVDLTALPIGLSKLHGLRYLNFRNNQLDTLPRNELSGLLSLEELTISDNEVTEIPPLAFIDLPALRHINLRNNRIQSLDANSFVNLDELEQLDISGNNISDISMISFPPLPKLNDLQLQNNPIRVIFLNAFHYLNNTAILTIGQSQQSMHIMKHSFQGLGSIKTLIIPNLDNHMLEKDMFFGLMSLQSLTIRGQIKMTGSEAFNGASGLQSITLSHCRLRSLASDTFKGLTNLKALDLSSNAIMKLTNGLFDQLDQLTELQLQNNHLRHFPQQMVGHLRLHMLRLEENPWHCSCAMAKWNRSSIGRVKTVTGKTCDKTMTGCRRHRVRYIRDPSLRPVCYNPPELRGKRVFEAVRKYLDCFQ